MQPVMREPAAAILSLALQGNMSNVEALLEHRLRRGTHNLGIASASITTWVESEGEVLVSAQI
jgi:hypothetical protein